MRFFIYISVLVFLISLNATAQQNTNAVEGVTVIVPDKNKARTSYFTFAGGIQAPSLVNVPMVPVNAPNLNKESDMEVVIPGWFAQFGINKKTRSNFDIGLQGGYYENTVPVALEGQQSTSDWVLQETGSLLTEIFEEDIIRASAVISIRALIKYKIEIKNINLWLGIAGGTFSTVIDYSYSKNTKPNYTYRQNAFGASYLAGIYILNKDKEGKDKFGITLFGDIAGPTVNEFFINLFESGWTYNNPGGNHPMNPVRIGVALNVY